MNPPPPSTSQRNRAAPLAAPVGWLLLKILPPQPRLAKDREKGSERDFLARVWDNDDPLGVAEFLVAASLGNLDESVPREHRDDKAGGVEFRR